MSTDRRSYRYLVSMTVALLLVPGLGVAQQRGMVPDTTMRGQMDACPAMDMMSGMMSRGMMTTGGRGMMQGGMMQGNMGGAGMMMTVWGGDVMRSVMLFQPDQILNERVALDLDANQVARLETLRNSRQQFHQKSMQTMMSAARVLQEAFDAEHPDSAAVRAAAEAAMTPHLAMHATMVADAAVARSILTAAQQEKLLTLFPAGACSAQPPSSDTPAGHEQHHRPPSGW